MGSDDDFTLYLSHDKGEYFFTIFGRRKGKRIQFDFNVLTREELEDLKSAIELTLEPSTTFNIVTCARCGGKHRDLFFRKLAHPCDEYTHWAPCPNNDEPIMMNLTQ